MPKLAQFDPTVPAPSPVLGWYDMDLLDYPNPPPSDALITLTEDQWANRMTGFWAVADGALVAYTPPPPPPVVSTQVPVADFLARFTPQEQAAVQQVALTNVQIAVGMTMGLARGYIELDPAKGPMLGPWMAGLVAAGAVTQDRANHIIDINWTPP